MSMLIYDSIIPCALCGEDTPLGDMESCDTCQAYFCLLCGGQDHTHEKYLAFLALNEAERRDYRVALREEREMLRQAEEIADG